MGAYTGCAAGRVWAPGRGAVQRVRQEARGEWERGPGAQGGALGGGGSAGVDGDKPRLLSGRGGGRGESAASWRQGLDRVGL